MNTATLLEKAYRKYMRYVSEGDYGIDPIQLPHKYKIPEDIEVVAFIASVFSYGSRKVFVPLLKRYIARLGDNPSQTIQRAKKSELKEFSAGFKYRFNTASDLEALYVFLHRVLVKFKSLRKFFASKYDENKKQPVLRMLRKVSRAYSKTPFRKGKIGDIRTAMYLLPSPSGGSPCKRVLMFLRWLVRGPDGLDFGLWKFIQPKQLVIPLDTHVHRVSKKLGLIPESSHASLKTALALTKVLRKYDPKDPVRFDYAICCLGADGVY